MGVEQEVIQKSGSWYSYGEERLGQGREGVKKVLMENPELLKKIETHVKTSLGFIDGPTTEKIETEDAPETAKPKK
jgi:recombination protein RecA